MERRGGEEEGWEEEREGWREETGWEQMIQSHS